MYSDVAIVILNWNGKEHLAHFLPSVIKFSEQARIIIADNASSDESIHFIKTTYPSIEIIENTSNFGFAQGYNEALQKINSTYYLLLNSDIEVSKNWIAPLYNEIQNPLIAGCQPKIKSYRLKTHFEHAGAAGGYIDHNYYPFCRGRILHQIEEDHGQYDNITEIFWASGACFLIKAEIFHAQKGFDNSFFAHMEEIDLCWRIQKSGYQFLIVPESTVYHLGGGTLPYLSPQKTFLNFRNSLFMITKNHDGLLLPKLFYRLLLDGIAGLLFTFKGSPSHTISILKAHYAFYKRIPILLKQRKENPKIKTKLNFYRGSILWAFYFKRIKTFKKLNHRLFGM
jgi:GT2 family glycosyltransferase